MDNEKNMAIDEQNDASEADFATKNEIIDEITDNNTDLDDSFEEEFSSIPESFNEDEFDFDDGASSISSLLYDEDEATAESKLEQGANVSFTELRQQMQKIRSDAMELNQNITEDIAYEEPTEVEETHNEPTFETPFVLDNDISEEIDEEFKEEEQDKDKIEEATEITDSVQQNDIEEEPFQSNESVITEHVITIDRAKVRDNTPPEGRFIDVVFDAAELFVFTLLAVVLLISFCFRHSVVSGDSMLTTFNDGDRLIISNLFYKPEVGDIIVFDDRSNSHYSDEPIIKRVIAVGGDTVEIKDGIVYLNGEILDEENYVFWDLDGDVNGSRYFPSMDDVELITVPEGEVFVLGDNRGNSMDSRIVGTIKEDAIIGKVILKFYAAPEKGSNEKGSFVFETKFEKKEKANGN